MNRDILAQAQAAVDDARKVVENRLKVRDSLIREAYAASWTYGQIAEATGLSKASIVSLFRGIR